MPSRLNAKKIKETLKGNVLHAESFYPWNI